MSVLLELLDRKIVRILTSLARNPKEHFHIQKLSSRSKVPLSSTFRIVNKLVRLGFVEIIVIGKFKIYRLKQSDKTKDLMIEIGGRK